MNDLMAIGILLLLLITLILIQVIFGFKSGSNIKSTCLIIVTSFLLLGQIIKTLLKLN